MATPLLTFVAAAIAVGVASAASAQHSAMVMQRLKDAITCIFEETATGGVVRISTSNAQAQSAIHEFLTYQVTDHKIGDPLSPSNHAAANQGHEQAGTRWSRT